jgi:hypothetical protein
MQKRCLSFKSDAVVDFDKDSFHVCIGTVQNEIKNRMFKSCANAIHCDLRFREFDTVLDCYGVVKYNEWADLSGCAVLDNQCYVAEML